MSSQIIQQATQNKTRFADALRSGKITLSQYQQAIAVEDAKIAAERQRLNAPTPTAAQVKTEQARVGIYTGTQFQAGQQNPTMQEVVIPAAEVAAVVGLSLIPGAAPVVLGGAALGVGANIGIESVAKSVETGQAQLVLPTSVREVTDAALEGAALSLVGAGVVGGVAKVAPKVAAQTIGRVAVNTGVNTAIGAGTSAAASGGDVESTLKGAAFGAALGLGGEAAAKVGGKIASIPKVQEFKDVTVGSKFTELTGVKEVAVQKTVGGETTITRVSEPVLETVKLKGADAKYYRETNISTISNAKLELAGREIKTVNPGVEGEVFLKPVESSRSADSMLAAIKGEQFKAGKVEVGELGGFVKTPSDFSAVQKVTVESFPRKGTVMEKTIASNPDAILPAKQVSFRDYTGVEVRGKVDPQIFADPAKALPTNISQDIYKKLGGGTKQGSSIFDVKTPRGKGNKGLNEAFKETPTTKGRGFASGEGKGKSVLREVTKTEGDVKLNRAIVGEAKIATGLKLSGAGALTGVTQTKDTAQGAGQTFRVPTAIGQGTGQRQRSGNIGLPDSGIGDRTTPTFPVEITTPTNEPPFTVNPIIDMPTNEPRPIPPIHFTPTPTKPQPPTPIDIVKPKPIQEPDFKVNPIPGEREEQKVRVPPFIGHVPKNPIKEKQITPLPPPPFPPLTKTRSSSFMFRLPAGGFGKSGMSSFKTGRWYQKKHKIKSASQMLQTFGVGGGKGAKTAGFKMPTMKMGGFTPKRVNSKAMFNMGNMGMPKSFRQPKRKRR